MKYENNMIGLNEIPNDWEISLISDFAKVATGAKDTQNKVDGGQYPFFVRSQTIERIDSYSFDGEAILTAGDGVGVGKVFHYINGKFDYHQRVYNIYGFSNKVYGRYFFEFFKKNFIYQVEKYNAKGSVDSVRMEMITKMNILIPPFLEQKKIVAILSNVNEKIEIVDEQIAQCLKLKKGLMQKLLTRGIGHLKFQDSILGEIPESWEVKTADQIGIQFIDGDRGINYPNENDFLDRGYCLFLSAKNVTKNGFRFDECQFINQEKDDQLRKGKLSLWDIVITTRGSVGNIALLDTRVKFTNIRLNSGMVILRDGKQIFDKSYLYQYLKSSIFQDQVKTISFGSAQPQLTIKELKKIKLLVIPFHEQQQIATILTTVDDKLDILHTKKKSYQELKKGLMQQLLTGKVRVLQSELLNA